MNIRLQLHDSLYETESVLVFDMHQYSYGVLQQVHNLTRVPKSSRISMQTRSHDMQSQFYKSWCLNITLISFPVALIWSANKKRMKNDSSRAQRFNLFKPEFPIVIFIYYKPRIAAAIRGL